MSEPCPTVVYVLSESNDDGDLILGVFSALGDAMAQTTAQWQYAPWTGDGTLIARQANFHAGIGVDFTITTYVVDALVASTAPPRGRGAE